MNSSSRSIPPLLGPECSVLASLGNFHAPLLFRRQFRTSREGGWGCFSCQSVATVSRTSTSYSCRDTWIAEQLLNWSGLPVTHLRPTYFLEWLLYPWQLPLFREKG